MTNILDNIGETGWFQVHKSWRSGQSFSEPGYRAVTDRTHVTQFLGEDHIRTQRAQERLIDRVDRPLLAQRAAHPFIHLPASHPSLIRRRELGLPRRSIHSKSGHA